MNNCLICDAGCRVDQSPGVGTVYYCDRCGAYQMTPMAAALASEDTTRGEFSSAARAFVIRQMQRHNKLPMIDEDIWRYTLLPAPIPTPMEQIDMLVDMLGQERAVGRFVEVRASETAFQIGVVDARRGVAYLLSEMESSGLVKTKHDVSTLRAQLTLVGWQRYDELQRSRPDSRTAFMAQQFGDAELDALVNEHFRPAVADTGFTLRRVDDKPRAGLIDDQLRVDIRNARFLICDLSHGNRGAYWEAGYAEGLGKPVIYTCEKQAFDAKDTRPHFDTNHHLTVIWSTDDPADSVRRLKATIRATILDAIQEDPHA